MLPKIDKPVYSITLPLSKKELKYTPFTVKEQRNLLLSLETGDIQTMEKNIEQVLKNCTITEGIEISKLPLIDVEYYFLHLRARSVGEIVENQYVCNNEVDGKQCGNNIKVSFNILDIPVTINEDVTDTIKLTDNIIIKLKYPEYSVVKRMENSETVTDFAFNLIIESIDYIHDGEQYYYASETDPAELVEFVNSLNTEQFAKIENFFNNLPSLRKDLKVKCPKCGFEHEITIEGIESFFE